MTRFEGCRLLSGVMTDYTGSCSGAFCGLWGGRGLRRMPASIASHVHAVTSVGASVRSRLLCNQFTGGKFNEHGAICFEFFHRHRKSKVVEEEKLEFQIVELR